MPHLFDPFASRELNLRNRVVMSPMCQYSARADGTVTDWHYVHYGARAQGGVGAVIVEMTQVQPNGRLSPSDVGLWDDAQVPGLRRIVEFVHGQGAKIGIQLGHAGRKADPMFEAVAPSAIAFSDQYRVPEALSLQGITGVKDAFVTAARRALDAGFDLVELHGAHGYLLHQFLSPLSNRRDDAYGGDLDGRSRLLLEVAEAVRDVFPAEMPVWTRLSLVEGIEGGLTLEESVEVARRLKAAGVDLIDCTSGGNAPTAEREFPGFRLANAAAVREGAAVSVMPVGRLEFPELAEAAIASGQADLIALARGLLRDPHWALRAQQALHLQATPPEQYRRAYR